MTRFCSSIVTLYRREDAIWMPFFFLVFLMDNKSNPFQHCAFEDWAFWKLFDSCILFNNVSLWSVMYPTSYPSMQISIHTLQIDWSQKKF
jgi:hypothetical protein